MIRRIFWLIKCTVVFSSLILATTGAGAEDLTGSDVFVIGQHAYLAGGSRGLYVVDIRPANPKQVAVVQI
ncbi:MAG: hypothetical protein KJP06_02585, partial [Deltaproteobacteria bacterium]|nr:hypothetical protein [Deltaproteobacteria bacterium]